jgi:FrmR/RcnR family transcriptional regulator, repressor of frmRAB operon
LDEITAQAITSRDLAVLESWDGGLLAPAEERALDGEAGCAQIMHQIAGCRGAINSLLVEVVEDHIRTHLVDSAKNPEALDAEAAARLIEVVHSYFR